MTLASDNALRLLRESRDGARIFEPGEVERLARLAGVAVEYVRVNLATGESTVQRVDATAPSGSDAGTAGANSL